MIVDRLFFLITVYVIDEFLGMGKVGEHRITLKDEN